MGDVSVQKSGETSKRVEKKNKKDLQQTQGHISIDTCLELQLEVKIQTQLELGDLSPLGGPRYLLRRIARAAAKRIRIAAVSV